MLCIFLKDLFFNFNKLLNILFKDLSRYFEKFFISSNVCDKLNLLNFSSIQCQSQKYITLLELVSKEFHPISLSLVSLLVSTEFLDFTVIT